jgi:hypothetical protein
MTTRLALLAEHHTRWTRHDPTHGIHPVKQAKPGDCALTHDHG